MLIREKTLLDSYLKYTEGTSYIANGTNLNKFKVCENLIDLKGLLSDQIEMQSGELCISALATLQQ